MEQLNLNTILNRDTAEDKLKEILNLFEKNKQLMTTRRGIYIYGSPGSGKTYFVKDILKKLDYDIILNGLDSSVTGWTPDVGHIRNGEMDVLSKMKEFSSLINHIGVALPLLRHSGCRPLVVNALGHHGGVARLRRVARHAHAAQELGRAVDGRDPVGEDRHRAARGGGRR